MSKSKETQAKQSETKQSVREKIWGNKSKATEAALKNLDEDLADLIINVSYENVFARENLDLRTRELISIAHLLTVGTSSELKTHIYGAINNGSSIAEIKEVLIHSAMFIGFPKVLKAMKTLKDVEQKLQAS